MKKKAKLLETTYDGEEMQVLDIMEFIVQCTKRKSYRHTSELSCYRMSAHIFDLILNDTSLQMIDGENCSQATKTAQQDNQRICSDDDDTKKLIGRKIDLIIAKYGVELSSSEWKKSQTTPATIEQQRVKNFRSNCAILNKILNLPINDASEIHTLGMDWLGMVGCMYAFDTYENIFSIHYAGDLVIPENIGTLYLLKETLDLLYSFKHHHVNLSRSIQSSVEKSKIADQLRKLRPEPIRTKREIGPVVFFTPSKRQKKTTK
ncbi:hypothetical protein BD408DRAFT_138530 [Parasitella parasitica]|nr:hypothetical protein BD408DRAFT_138530 [Parasitella parasitica]